MNFLETFDTKTRTTAMEFIKSELKLRALSNISEAKFDIHMPHPTMGTMTIRKNAEFPTSDDAEKYYNDTHGAERGREFIATESPFSGKEGSSEGAEGDIHTLTQDPYALARKLGLSQHLFQDSGNEYSETSSIHGVDGSVHHIYTKAGIARIRPVKATPEQTEDLMRYIDESPTSVRESVDSENNRNIQE